jgi:CMP-N,N'-diacetyllegionaminic acid synthase
LIRGETLTAVIPVRGGSKGIPRKNLIRIGRDTLLERTIKLGLLCNRIDKVIVSTDDLEMFEISSRYGVSSCGLRPSHLAVDSALTIDVILDLLERGYIDSGFVMLLQVTSPLRTQSDLNQFLNQFSETTTGALASASVCRIQSPHPDKIQKIENGFLRSYSGRESMVPRQSLPPVYSLNGAFYINHSDSLLEERTFLPKKTLAFEMDLEKSLNLDSITDLVLLEALIQRQMVALEEL